tara:strand:+ start:1563 stop:1964 length:402 start_codon:yes stop_codon:yes gene_type:complete
VGSVPVPNIRLRTIEITQRSDFKACHYNRLELFTNKQFHRSHKMKTTKSELEKIILEEVKYALGEGRMKYLEGEIVNGIMSLMQQYDVTLEEIKGVIDSGAVQNVMDMLSDKNRPPREPMTPEKRARMYTKTI